MRLHVRHAERCECHHLIGNTREKQLDWHVFFVLHRYKMREVQVSFFGSHKRCTEEKGGGLLTVAESVVTSAQGVWLRDELTLFSNERTIELGTQ